MQKLTRRKIPWLIVEIQKENNRACPQFRRSSVFGHDNCTNSIFLEKEVTSPKKIEKLAKDMEIILSVKDTNITSHA